MGNVKAVLIEARALLKGCVLIVRHH